MTIRLLRIITVLAIVPALGACATAQTQYGQAAEGGDVPVDCATGARSASALHEVEVREAKDLIDNFNRVLDQRICRLEDPRADGADPHRGHRILRGQMAVALIAIYGDASIRRYSENPKGEATELIEQIKETERAMATLIRVGRATTQEKHFYPVERLQFVGEAIELGVTATEPTAREMRRSVLSSRLDRLRNGFKLLKNLLVTKAYQHAYEDSFRSMFREIGNAEPKNEHWAIVNGLIEQACKRLYAHVRPGEDTTNDARTCVAAGIPR